MAVRVLGEPGVTYSSESIGDVGASVSVLVDPPIMDNSIQAVGGERIADPHPPEVTYYRMRALDQGTSEFVPVYWTSLTPDLSGAPAPPNGGPYGDPQVMDRWVQRASANI